jgi:hypothetical protein
VTPVRAFSQNVNLQKKLKPPILSLRMSSPPKDYARKNRVRATMPHCEMPLNVLADSLWILSNELTPENTHAWINAMKECWTSELAADWWPALVVNMDDWLYDYCMVEKVRNKSLVEWREMSEKIPHAFYIGGSPFPVKADEPVFSVMIKNIDPSVETADLLYTMSAIGDDASITRLYRPKFPNGKYRRFAIVDYTSKMYMKNALCWSERITLGGNVLTIEECKTKQCGGDAA